MIRMKIKNIIFRVETNSCKTFGRLNGFQGLWNQTALEVPAP
jgi:hypothetical protein